MPAASLSESPLVDLSADESATGAHVHALEVLHLYKSIQGAIKRITSQPPAGGELWPDDES